MEGARARAPKKIHSCGNPAHPPKATNDHLQHSQPWERRQGRHLAIPGEREALEDRITGEHPHLSHWLENGALARGNLRTGEQGGHLAEAHQPSSLRHQEVNVS